MFNWDFMSRGTSLNPKEIVAVQFVPVQRAKNDQFRIRSVVEKQMQHNRSAVMLHGLNPYDNFDWPYLSQYLIDCKTRHIKVEV